MVDRGVKTAKQNIDWRMLGAQVFVILFAAALLIRLFSLQVSGYSYYSTLASRQYNSSQAFTPQRGEILIQDKNTPSALATSSKGNFYPVAINKKFQHLVVSPKDLTNPDLVAAKLALITGLPIADIARGIKDNSARSYYVVKKDLTESEINSVTNEGLKGVWLEDETRRYYPEGSLLAHVLGFIGNDDKGQKRGAYGIERQFEDVLSGAAQIESGDIVPDQQGSNLVLTIDHAIQVEAETVLKKYVEKFRAEQGTVVVVNPKTGAVLAMASAPDFNPNEYGKVEDIAVFSNPAVQSRYEPGSVIKPLAMAAALDLKKLSPNDTFEDTGRAVIRNHVVTNSDKKSHGIQTMIEVLNKSLNTGMVYVQSVVGNDNLKKYFKNFGFEEKTGITLPGEIKGDLRNMSGNDPIAQATAAFGQGISMTPVELVQAYAAIANKGQMPRLHIVSEVYHPDGTREIVEPEIIRRVLSENAAAQISGMLVDVIENGHGHRAGVAGYYIGGKTGTAQIPLLDRPGYDPDGNIGNFVGFGPVEDPTFVMLMKIDRPKGVEFAESSVAPAWGEIAKFILNYQQVTPSRQTP